MLSTQTQYVEFLKFLDDSVEAAALSTSPVMDSVRQTLVSKTNAYSEAIEQVRLLVPMTGSFSAGKSSLLNALLGETHLPIGITPETALAAELHFGAEQRIEAVSAEGAVEIFALPEFQTVTQRASEFEYLRIFVNAPLLDKLAPLILVDMPGFDAPLELHNRAIINFIDRGAHYLVLVSVEDGGLTTQALNRLRGILDTGRSFTLCLSKVDLRPETQVKEIASHIADQLAVEFSSRHEIVILDPSSSAKKLQAVVQGINPDHLVRTLFKRPLKNMFLELDTDINAVLAALEKSALEIQNTLDDLRIAVERVEQEKDRQLQQLNDEKREGRHLQKVLNSIRHVLEGATEQLVQSAMQGEESFSRHISEVIQAATISALRTATGEISEDTIQRFSQSMSGSIRAGFAIPPDVISDLIEQIKDPLTNAILAATTRQTKGKGKTKFNQQMGESIAQSGNIGAMIALAAGAGPWAVAAIAIAPAVVDMAFSLFKGARQRDVLLQVLPTQVFPDILRQLRPEVEGFLEQATESAIAAVAQKYEEHLGRQRQILTDAEKNQDLAKVESQKESIKELLSALRSKADSAIFSV